MEPDRMERDRQAAGAKGPAVAISPPAAEAVPAGVPVKAKDAVAAKAEARAKAAKEAAAGPATMKTAETVTRRVCRALKILHCASG